MSYSVVSAEGSTPDIDEEISTNRRLEEMLKAAVEAGGGEQKTEDLQGALSQAQLQFRKLESQRDLQQADLDKKENEYYNRVGEDLNEARTEELLSELGLPESEVYPDLILIDQRTNTAVSHRDVGIGISQVLPVLVMAYGSQGKILAMEQPEIHLHPALQAELGDVFIESALGEKKNTFILETHSEHLILRIMRRLRESSEGSLPPGIPQLTADDVQVLYVEPLQEGSVAREMPLNSHGELVKAWPGGFFEEGLREVMP